MEVYNGKGYASINGVFDQDTDEYDDAVIGHELGHYFMRLLSRDMTLQGGHQLNQKVDWTLAFSEAWATAYQAAFRSASSGSSNNSPDYIDFRMDQRLSENLIGSSPSQTITLSNLPASTNPSTSPSGIWEEVSCVKALWRMYNSPSVMALDPKLFLQTSSILPFSNMTTMYGWRSSLRQLRSDLNAQVDAVLKMEGCLDANGQLLSQEPWLLENGGHGNHNNFQLKGGLEDSNGKDSAVYYAFTPTEQRTYKLVIKVNALPTCSRQIELGFLSFIHGNAIGKSEDPEQFVSISNAGQELTFTLMPSQINVPHIIRLRLRVQKGCSETLDATITGI
jgi:hypothetical protein